MRIMYVAAAGALMLGAVACDADAPPQKPVSGLRDDIKHKAAVKAVAAKTHTVKGIKEEKYCTRSVKGVCKSYGKRNVPNDKVVTDAPAKPFKPALYCVELDNVNGSAKDDDVWYTTTATTYRKAQALEEGEPMEFKPLHGGCW